MLKHVLFLGLCLVGSSALLVTSWPNAAIASEQVTSEIVTGTVSFEKRSTVIPLSLCDRGQPCARSKVYWSMVVQGESTRYEINKAFAVGSNTAPESVELAGIVIRPGSRVAVEGKVESISPEYALICEVKRATIVMDSENAEADQEKLVSMSYGWMCRSPDGAQPQVYVDLHTSMEERDHDIYEMRISAGLSSEDVSVYPLVTVPLVTMKLDQTRILYEGATSRMKAELAIEKTGDGFSALPSALVLTEQHNMRTLGNSPSQPAAKAYPLMCTRTRM